MNPATLFALPDEPRPVVNRVSDWHLSVFYDQHEALRSIAALYLRGEGFEVDPTYSTGQFYASGFPEPKHRFDLTPQVPGVQQADCTRLPLADASVRSVIFDPPFAINGEGGAIDPTGRITQRFTSFRTYAQLAAMYQGAINEFARILKPRGVFVIKCQDQVSSSKQHLIHVDVVNWARAAGFTTKDLAILVNQSNLLMGSSWRGQQHLRKAHSYFLVFIKACTSRKPAPMPRGDPIWL